MRIALYQPEIAGNVGAILRLAACFGVAVDIIEPCGFAFSDSRLKRAGMDYAAQAEIVRHSDWHHFNTARTARLILMTTKGRITLDSAPFRADDILLFGNEGHGAPADVHQAADLTVRIPLFAGFRSLNLGMSAGIALYQALRQTGGLPP